MKLPGERRMACRSNCDEHRQAPKRARPVPRELPSLGFNLIKVDGRCSAVPATFLREGCGYRAVSRVKRNSWINV
jgi:hypothetical protein